MNKIMRLRYDLVALAAVALASVPFGQAQAQAWPAHPIEFVCATSAGSGAANWCQLFAELTGNALGKPVKVLFKGGGNGNEAAEYVATRPADGYTWLQRNTSYAGYMNLPTFKPDPNDFVNVVNVEKFIYILAVPGNSKYKTFDDLLQDMRAHPGKIGFAGNKIGSAHHIHLIKLFDAFGVDGNMVPYQGAGGAMKDTLGGHVPVGLGPPGIWLPHVKSGKARFLLLLNEEHVDRTGLKGLKIPKDYGKDYKFSHQTQGMFVKRGAPAEVQNKIVAAFKAAVETDKYKDYVKRNPHVIPVFDGDAAANTREFHQLREATGRFLRKSGLIK